MRTGEPSVRPRRRRLASNGRNTGGNSERSAERPVSPQFVDSRNHQEYSKSNHEEYSKSDKKGNTFSYCTRFFSCKIFVSIIIVVVGCSVMYCHSDSLSLMGKQFSAGESNKIESDFMSRIGTGLCRFKSTVPSDWSYESSCVASFDCALACERDLLCVGFSYARIPEDNLDLCKDRGLGRCVLYTGMSVPESTSTGTNAPASTNAYTCYAHLETSSNLNIPAAIYDRLGSKILDAEFSFLLRTKDLMVVTDLDFPFPEFELIFVNGEQESLEVKMVSGQNLFYAKFSGNSQKFLSTFRKMIGKVSRGAKYLFPFHPQSKIEKECPKCQSVADKSCPLPKKLPGCKDRRDSCDKFECHKPEVRLNCAETCNVCNYTGVYPAQCEDTDPDCPDNADRCFDVYVAEICPKTCSVCFENDCPEPESTEPAASAHLLDRSSCEDASALCESHKEHCDDPEVRDACKKTCGFCETDQKSADQESAEQKPAPNAHLLDPSQCEDLSSLCEAQKERCDDPEVRDACKKTCGLCEKVQESADQESASPILPCEDYDEQCEGQKDQCNYAEVREVCKKTCGVCKEDKKGAEDPCKDSSSICEFSADQCDDPEISKVCQKTCGTCQTCEDKSSLCDNLQDQCAEDKIKTMCPKTCNACEKTAEQAEEDLMERAQEVLDTLTDEQKSELVEHAKANPPQEDLDLSTLSETDRLAYKIKVLLIALEKDIILTAKAKKIIEKMSDDQKDEWLQKQNFEDDIGSKVLSILKSQKQQADDQPESQCADKSPQCEDYTEEQCQNLAVVRETCPKTCGICTESVKPPKPELSKIQKAALVVLMVRPDAKGTTEQKDAPTDGQQAATEANESKACIDKNPLCAASKAECYKLEVREMCPLTCQTCSTDSPIKPN